MERHGFTLVELLVVIAIIGVLVALLLPAIQAAREAARRSQCSNNLRQIAIAIHNYESAHGQIPGGSGWGAPASAEPTARNRLWTIDIMPFMENQAIHDSLDLTRRMEAAPNVQHVATIVIPGFICPSDSEADSSLGSGILDFRRTSNGNPQIAQGNWYPGSMGPTIPDFCDFSTAPQACMGSHHGTTENSPSPCFANQSCPDNSLCVGMLCRSYRGTRFREVTDGLSNTYLLGESLPTHNIYNCLFCINFPISSTQIPLNTMDRDDNPAASYNTSAGGLYWRTSGFKSMHPGGAHVAMSDSSVTFVQEDIDYMLYNAMGTKAASDDGTGQSTQSFSSGGGRE